MDAAVLAAKRRAYRQALAGALDRIVAALARLPGVRRVVLFGSYAEGRADLLTDLDLLVVMGSPLSRAELYRYLSLGVDVDLLGYAPEELERARRRGFLRRVLERGRCSVPTRYPDGLPDGIPPEAYTRAAAGEAVRLAEEAVKRVSTMVGPQDASGT